MLGLPKLKLIETQEELSFFGEVYFRNSGLPVPEQYLANNRNKVFGIYLKGEMIGGFILGNGPDYRTIEVFAKEELHVQLYDQMFARDQYTEICCFWIKKAYRTKTGINFFIWLSMAFSLKKYGSKYILFGTCSRALAKLYATTPKSILFHTDRINKKHTFIFQAVRKTCITGILEIVKFKLYRVLNIKTAGRNQPIPRVQLSRRAA